MTSAVPGGPAPFLSLRGVRRSFGGVHALDGISLDILPGEVHTLAGENGSGKSTLIKIIAGVVRPNEGTIDLAGRSFTHLTPATAIAHGIQVIYQDLSLFPNLSVAENLALNTLLEHRVRVARRSQMRNIARKALECLHVNIDLACEVERLSMAQRQLVAIARALVQGARFVILDEPTTALTSVEITSLFQVVRRLVAQGTAILFVSHKIREMRDISDRFTILRNGRVADEGLAPDFDRARLVRAMTGRTVTPSRRPPSAAAARATVLGAIGLSGGALRGVTFDLAAGEILGVTGRLGAGQADLALLLAGARSPWSGQIEIDGSPRRFTKLRQAVREGVAYVPSDRLREGLLLDQSIARNITATTLRRAERRFGCLSTAALSAEAVRWCDEMGIRAPSVEAPARVLSGGNQQRVVLAKWLATDPKVIVLNGPTVGVDIGAKIAIHALMRRLADRGLAIVMISDDLEELVEHADRVLVLAGGTIAADLPGVQLSEDVLAAHLTAAH